MKKIFAAALAIKVIFTSAYAADDYTIELYETYCKACHIVAGANAPAAFDEQAWQKRLEDGLDALVNKAISGIGNMPAQGSCMECTYEDFEDLINYMSRAQEDNK